MKQILLLGRIKKKMEADRMKRKKEKKRKDKDGLFDLLDLITSAGELIFYGVRALIRWWN